MSETRIAPSAATHTGPSAAAPPTPGAAPRRRDPEGRRRAILEAAAEIIVTKGPAALTHRAVASLAGVALGSTTQYFASIDELRETALAELAQEIDRALDEFDAASADPAQIPEWLARDSYQFLRNARAVHADVALMSSGITDPQLRPLALKWTDRIIEILSRRLGEDRATAIALYLDGATVHAALHDEPIDQDRLERTIRALVVMPVAAPPGGDPGTDPEPGWT